MSLFARALPRALFRVVSKALGLFAAAAAFGAAATAGVFALTGPGGRRRRALARDRIVHLKHETAAELDKARRDLRHRAQGVAARVRPDHKEHDDLTLVQRARAELGHVCSHPHAVTIEAHGGRLLVKGLVLAPERKAILKTLRKIPGVHDVDDQLEAHDGAEGIPALQGGHPRRRRPEFLQENWSPGTRVVAGGAGAGLVLLSLAKRHPLTLAAGLLGGLLAVRAIVNRDLRSLRGPFRVHKSIFIGAPVREVFSVFARPEQFPRFMTHVKAVQRIDEDHYKWRVDGPLGSFTSTWEITRWLPEQSIAWRSDDRLGRLAGTVEFTPEDGGTRLEVQLAVAPPAGGLGHALARMLQRDPKRLLDADLMRLKSLLENGKATGNASQVSLEEVFG